MRLGRYFLFSLLGIIVSSVLAIGQNQEVILHRFQLSDGAGPQGSLIADPEGNLYGMTNAGGDGPCTYNRLPSGCGTIFELSPRSGGGWSEQILYSFQGGTDGAFPLDAGLVSDQLGNLYGTTSAGGIAGNCPGSGSPGCGTAFELSPPSQPGGVWSETVLYRFTNGLDGSYPRGSLVLDQIGDLYGTTNDGGLGGGVVFELTPSSGGGWTETTLHVFGGGKDGYLPVAGLIFDLAGNLYGTTAGGGGSQNCNYGCGTVFQLAPPESAGGQWTERIVYSFQGGADGRFPSESLLLIYGSLVGTTENGGQYGMGTVFQIMQTPHGIVEVVLYSFQGGNDGFWPLGLVADNKINLYGATAFGGSGNCPTGPGCGTVFRLSPPTPPGGQWIKQILYTFQDGEDGFVPWGTLLLGNGWLVGGTVSGGGSQNCSTNGIIGCGAIFAVHP